MGLKYFVLHIFISTSRVAINFSLQYCLASSNSISSPCYYRMDGSVTVGLSGEFACVYCNYCMLMHPRSISANGLFTSTNSGSLSIIITPFPSLDWHRNEFGSTHPTGNLDSEVYLRTNVDLKNAFFATSYVLESCYLVMWGQIVVWW